MKHWHKDNADDDVTSNSGRFVFVPPYQQARSLDIEMTSYALLIYARRRDLTGGLAIAKWIVAQRNANGGFSSTQVSCDVITMMNGLIHSRWWLVLGWVTTNVDHPRLRIANASYIRRVIKFYLQLFTIIIIHIQSTPRFISCDVM